ncbi:acyltransferase [Tautonia marina]|uniref:acyltransferase n=1 Tax=Tautonia marina TaxID=2653855 RepID=UPI00137553F7|nr:DapH/DapD/GlmU-related protein [Tautonia marina]
MTLDHCSWDVGFGFGTILAHREVRVGRRVSCGSYCTIGMAVFEDDVMLGSNVDLLSGRRQHHTDDTDRPIQDQGGTFTPVRIGRNSWIGNSAVVMADVGSDAVVGAGSVVVKPVPSMVVAAGNPAQVIRQRREGASEAFAGVSLRIH